MQPKKTENIMYQRTTVVTPQGNNYGCALCSLEYISGVPRDEIARDIGHDGSEVIDPSEPEPYCFATIVDMESIYWLFEKGLAPTKLVTFEYMTADAEKNGVPRYHKRFYPSVNAIKAMLDGKAAELTVRSSKFAHAWHSVTYLDGIVLDPKDGCVHKLDEYEIVSAIFTNIDPIQRLREIHGAQPREAVAISGATKSAEKIHLPCALDYLDV